MDPIFGMVALPDSKAMDTAKQRNTSQQKDLERNIARLEDECYSKTSKINSDVGELYRMLQESKPRPESRIVFPLGLSSGERQQYRQLHRGSLPSMTLEQFDSKLNEVRNRREKERGTTGFHSSGKKAPKGFLEITQESKIVTESANTTARRRSVVLNDAMRRSAWDGLNNLRTTDHLTLPPLHRRQSQSEVVANSEVYRPKENIATGDTTESPLPVNRARRGSRFLTPEGRQLNTGVRASVKPQRRSTMPEIGGLTVFRQRYGSGDDDTLGNSDSILSKVDDIIETWRSSPAVKPSSTYDSPSSPC